MKKYLLDTHTAIWYFENNGKLSLKVELIIDDPENNINISSASLWEIAIKVSGKKLDLSFMEFLDKLRIANFPVMQFENSYLSKLINLPFVHKDPFDRLLIATAMAEKMAILTADENIHKYDVDWVW